MSVNDTAEHVLEIESLTKAYSVATRHKKLFDGAGEL